MMSEERRMILEMLREGKITVDEAEKLMETAGAGASGDKGVIPRKEESPNRKFLHIMVTDGEGTNVNVNIPVALAEVGLRMLPQEKLVINDKKIDIDEILDLIEEGTKGELVSVDAVDEGKETKVKVYIE